jgi:lipoprotein-anchoring transpeptidase ErfK/SrfK
MILPLLVGSLVALQVPDTGRAAATARPAPVRGPAAGADAPRKEGPITQAGGPSEGEGSSHLAAVGRFLSRLRGKDAPHPVTYLASVLEGRRLSPARSLSFIAARVAVKPPSELAPTMVDSLVVEKRLRVLTAYFNGSPVKRYRVALGRNPVGDKVQRGDDRTPEGIFRIDWRNPRSQYFLALHISYPEPRHRERAARLGVDPGGDILIHGLPPRFQDYGKAHLQWDWTNGCVALTNQEIEELWRAVPDGTPIEIKP